MEYEMRPIVADELEVFLESPGAAFGRQYRPEWIESIRQTGEFDRSTSVWDEGQVVGTTGVYSFDMAVPGGVMPTAGVTWVSVRPTHRRRGILSAMMRNQLAAIHERGEPLAALWPTESVIYGRFGYGSAVDCAQLTMNRNRVALRGEMGWGGRCRFVNREAALAEWPGVYARVLPRHPGMHSRHDAWWAHRILPETPRAIDGQSAPFFVQYEEGGRIDGYVMYRVQTGDVNGIPAGKLFVTELMAATDAAYAALWEFVFGVDLISEIHADFRRVDEPLLGMLTDPRQIQRQVQDAVWARLVDVPAALSGRRYRVEGSLVFEVADEVCPWNVGRYVLEGGPDGAACQRTTREADLTLNVDVLGSVFMGGPRFEGYARAGRVSGSAEAIRRADAMFQWDAAPWSPDVF